MAQIGSVNAVFTASTSGLTQGIGAAARAFRSLGGDSAALNASLNQLNTLQLKGFENIGPAATAAGAAFASISSNATQLREQLKAGAITSDQFRDSMAQLTQQASVQAQVFAAGAATTQRFVTAEETFAATSSSLRQQLDAGAISTATFDRAMEAAQSTLNDATGVTAAAAAAAREQAEAMSRGAAITASVASAEERHAARVAELQAALDAGTISTETFNRATAAAQATLNEATGVTAAAAAATRAQAEAAAAGAAITASVATAQERYAARITELQTALDAGTISSETFARASAAAQATLDEATGVTAAAAAAARELEATRRAGEQATNAVMTADERYSARVQELNGLLAAGVITQQTYDRSVAAASTTLENASGLTAAAAAAERARAAVVDRGAAVTREARTATEVYGDRMAELRSLLAAGAITQQTFARATEQARTQMRQAAAAANSASGGVDSLGKKLNALIGIEIAKFFTSFVSYVSQAVRSLISFGLAEGEAVDKTSKLAARLGMTYGELASIGVAGELAGVSLEQIGAAATKADVAFVKAANGSKEAAAKFATLGLNVQQLAGMNAADRFNTIAQSIAALPTEAERAAAAVAIFGRSGAELMPLFNGGAEAIRQASEDAKAFGLNLTTAQGEDVEAMNDAFTRAGNAIQGIVQQIVAYLAPAVTAVTEQFSNFIASVGGANIGQLIGDGILQGAEYLAGVGDWIIANMSSVFQYLSAVGEQLAAVWDIAGRVASFLSGVFNGAAAIFRMIILGFSGTFEALARIAQKIGSFLGFDTSSLDAIVAGAAAFNDTLSDGITQNLAAAQQGFSDAFSTSASQAGQAVAGPLTTALKAGRDAAKASADAIDEAKTAPVSLKQDVEVTGIAQALKGVDSRSKEGVAEMFRLMRGDTGNVQEQQLDALNKIADNTSGMEDTPAFALSGA